MSEPIPWTKYAELATLFFLHGMAMAMWFVPLSTVLDAHGLHSIKPYAFATSATAAFVSPLLFGAMADRHLGPVPVFRGIALFAAAALLSVSSAIENGASPWMVLALIQVLALFSSPSWSIVATVVLSALTDPPRQFGPIRAVATLGWMAGCWVISAMGADSSTMACYSAALVWLLVAGFTFFLPNIVPPKSREKLTLAQRFGWDAIALIKHPEHRAVFLTAAFVAVPLAGFYPFTPPHLKTFGLVHTTAWMTLGQVTEIVAMLGLARLLLNWRLKWVFAAGLISALLRYLFCALDTKLWVLLGVTLHGFAFTLFFVTAPIYLDGRVDPKWRARAQALMTLMTSGLGNLLGYIGCGWWFQVCDRAGGTHWTLFWGGLAAVVAAVLVYFWKTYQNREQPA